MPTIQPSPVCELPLQVMAVDGGILVVCAGSCGEAVGFVAPDDVQEILTLSQSIHRQIDRCTLNTTKPIAKAQISRLATAMREFGELLFEHVFRASILDLLNITIGQAIRLNSSITIKLMVASDWLNVIPWELLSSRGTYLCHTYDFVRHPFAIQPVRDPLSMDSDIRCLFVGGNPRNDLRITEQLDAVQKAIGTLSTKPKILLSPNATYTNIADAIYEGIDLIHFVAHGEFIPRGKSTQIYFVVDGEEQRKEDRLPLEMFQSFCRASPMQLAILNACRSDQALLYGARSLARLRQGGYNSVAHALVKLGIPCVIGMSHPVSKVGAAVLARRLYYVLINQKQSIAKAVRQARLEMFAHLESMLPSDWMTPVLYSRTSTPTLRHMTSEGA